MSQIQDFPGVQVVGVTQKPTRNGSTMYQVALSNGMTPSTFDAAVATKAHQLAGQPATVRLEEKPSNKPGGRPFINILDIAPQGQVMDAASGVPASFGAPAQATSFGQPQAFGQQAPAFQQAAPPQFPDVHAEKDKQAARGYSLGSAVTLFAGLYTGAAESVDDTELLGKILRWAAAFEHYRTTGKNIAEAAVESLATQAGVTPEQVAQAVNQAAPGAVVLGAAAEVEQPAEETTTEAPAASGIPWQQ